MTKLTHINNKGEAQMVDVGAKNITTRTATAKANILMKETTLQSIKENGLKKGDVLATARIAGIMAAKQTASLIPLCHQLNLTKISIDFKYIKKGIEVIATTKTKGKTGVEIEALTATSIASLTIYDMCKAIDRFMQITNITVVEKAGGQSGNWKQTI